MSNTWGAPTTRDEVCRRAGGRRHYNRWRQTVRELRRLQVLRLLRRHPLSQRGTVRAIARELGVHPATVCRDIQALLHEPGRCPKCGQLAAGGADDPDLADTILANCQADALEGTWRWAARGPLPRIDGQAPTPPGLAR